MAEVRVAVLGPTSVTVDGVPIALRSPLARRLLAALVLHRPAGASIDRLADELWGDELPLNPPGALANHVARLRAALGTEVIQGFPGGYQLGAADCDVDEYDRPGPPLRWRVVDGKVVEGGAGSWVGHRPTLRDGQAAVVVGFRSRDRCPNCGGRGGT